MTSIIVPAHDEERVIARCLEALLRDPAAPGSRRTIHVVANGCRDATAEVARRYADRGVVVLDLPEGGKIGALQAGDDAAGDDFPRLYVDADVEVGPGAVARVEQALTGGVHAAAPRLVVDVAGRPRAVRAYYREFLAGPWVRERMIGSGFYALSAQGRARFGAWPAVLNDDGFVKDLFAHDERRTVDAWFRIQAPRTVEAVVAAKTRVAVGNAELERLRGEGVLPPSRHVVLPGGLRREILDRARHPRGSFAAWGVRRRIRRATRLALATGDRGWSQDRTTR